MEHEQRNEIEVSELEWSFLFLIEETDGMDEILGSSWNLIPLVGGHSFSNEEMDEMLDSLWDSGSKVREMCSIGWSGVMSLLDDKDFLKLIDFLLECEKTNSKFNFFSRKYLALKTGVSANNSINGVARTVGKERIEGFTLKVDTLLDAKGLGGAK